MKRFNKLHLVLQDSLGRNFFPPLLNIALVVTLP
jgi:hypothetical protein